MFICVHLCSTCVHLCSLVFTCVHLCSFMFQLVFYLCSFVFHLCSYVFVCVPFVLIRVHLCSHLCGVSDKIVIEMDKFQMSIYLSKLKSLLIKRLDKDEMNGIERLHTQLRYQSWFNSSLTVLSEKNQGSTIDENDFEIPIVRLLHFVRTLNW